MKKYLVGGCVRDALLGLPVQDHDWVITGATPAEMLAQGYKQVGKDFPVFLHPQTKEEYALARTERKTGPGYYNFVVDYDPSVTLEEDLARRDLTINAIAQAEDGTIIDPYNGRADLKHKILRHVSPAFVEDPVRILRVARFAARFAPLGFTIAPETMQLMQQMVQAGEVDALVPERVWQEMQRALTEDAPEVFFTTLRSCSALVRIFPQLDCLWGIPQKAEHHPEIDTGAHMILCLQQAVKLSNKPEVRFAVLCHDLGKGITPKDDWPSHKGHEELGVKLIQDWCKQYHVPNDYRDLAIKVARFHLHAHRAAELRPDTMVKLFKSLDAFRNSEHLDEYILCCQADSTGRLGRQNDPYPNGDLLRKAFSAANSVDIQPLIDKGLTGEKLGDAIMQARIVAVKNILHKL
ncbi:MAG TPA: multifunctional CCA addition/repair protein [Gammaproteobacteria bacterium]|nr:multifunctional CCA addition/repair protein [Gammaproteobacteria bacterium]